MSPMRLLMNNGVESYPCRRDGRGPWESTAAFLKTCFQGT